MSNVAVLKIPRPDPHDAQDYLGPAEVVDAGPSVLVCRLTTGLDVEATLALATPYEPANGDVVLVIGRAERHYVIGVLSGSGKTRLQFRGDVDLHAQGGVLTLTGDSGVRVRGSEVEILASAVKVVADSLVQKMATAYQRVTGLLTVRAGESHTVVDGESHARSKTATLVTEGKMTINGKRINLGQ